MSCTANNPHLIDKKNRRGRAAGTNQTPRFERYESVAVDDGWDLEAEPPKQIPTHVSFETVRSAISYNKSPDLPFDRSINPYRGCEHGCIYCFARPTHAYLGLSPGLDFETKLIARPNLPQVLEDELRRARYRVATLAIGTNTDPYQPIEKKYEVMRGALRVLSACNHPVAIVTKGSLIERDLDILKPMAAKGLVRVGISVTTLDPRLSRQMEPRVPTPVRRLETIRRLTEAGLEVRVMASPLIPGISDHELENILSEASAAGAVAASWIMLRLPLEVSQLVRDWLLEHHPNRAKGVLARLREMHDGKEYDPRWHHRMRGSGPYAEMISNRFRVASARLGLDRELAPLRTDLFVPPQRTGDQLSLFSKSVG